MKKVSFSVSSAKPQSTFRRPSSSSSAPHNHQNQDSRKFITEYEYDSSETTPSEPIKNRQNRVIPPKPDEWMPSNDFATKFEVESSASSSSSTEDFISSAITYGLNLRKSTGARVKQSPALMSDVDPSLIRLREDLRRLPEATGFDEFEDMPVEEFGRALLAGYGWVEGMGIGRNAKGDVKVVECKKWTAQEGLGFIRAAPKPEH